MLQLNTQILIHQLTFAVSDDKPLFKALSLALGAEKTGLIGRNGIGKSTLLKLITGELVPDTGSIQTSGTIAYCPQQIELAAETTVADLLGISQQLAAFYRIQQGSTDDNDFQLLKDDWHIEERTYQQLAKFDLATLALHQPWYSLSGGEKTRLQLAKVFIANPDFIILDEPTNNLDIGSREFLYTAIAHWNKGLLVVSHDRTLLNLMQHIIELTSHQVNVYGGNYDHYCQQKNIFQEAAACELVTAKKALSATKSSIQTSREKREQKAARGRQLFLHGNIDKLSANSKKGRSERTQRRLTTQADLMLKQAEKDLALAKSKIESEKDLHIDLQTTRVPNGKIILEIKNLVFSYTGCEPIINHFNLLLEGPERIALMGNNGSGKTTLIKLILNRLPSSSGTISLGTSRISYLEQNANSLNPELSILDNFLNLNEDAKPNDAYQALAQFLFRNVSALKKVKNLSGGEKIRAELACALMSKQPPQLLILDEPTNHLDLESIISIESALKNYQGALIVISHDKKFLENINITRFIYAPYTTH